MGPLKQSGTAQTTRFRGNEGPRDFDGRFGYGGASPVRLPAIP
ncbi:MAG: hypothetical protein P8N31_04560 [Planctomycetota bacterium]|nr:hypothetical protein [Planctomycetota bacterium]MDG2142809.1 hypothetical protein [Planctomycetota bacterium]